MSVQRGMGIAQESSELLVGFTSQAYMPVQQQGITQFVEQSRQRIPACQFSVNGKSYIIKLRRNDRPNTVNVEVEGEEFLVKFQHGRKKMGREDAVAGITAAHVHERGRLPAKKKGAVTSVMPGRVVLLKVKEGDGVKVGDPLCILEAMKMENEIIASREGTVKEVRAKLGSIVDKGEVLFVIE